MGFNSPILKIGVKKGIEDAKTVGGYLLEKKQKAEDWLDDITGISKIPPETRKAVDAAMAVSPMGAGITISRIAKSIPASVITKEQIPFMKELGIFNKPPEQASKFLNDVGAEMRHIQTKAHIQGWDKTRTIKAYKDMESRSIERSAENFLDEQ
jgi:hypothetical protein